MLSSLSLTRSAESSVEPRLVVSNNDCTVRFYDIAVRGESSPKDLRKSGNLLLEEPINHCARPGPLSALCADLIFHISVDIPRWENTPLGWGFTTDLSSLPYWWLLHHVRSYYHPQCSTSRCQILFSLAFCILFHRILTRWYEVRGCFPRRRRRCLGRAKHETDKSHSNRQNQVAGRTPWERRRKHRT